MSPGALGRVNAVKVCMFEPDAAEDTDVKADALLRAGDADRGLEKDVERE